MTVAIWAHILIIFNLIKLVQIQLTRFTDYRDPKPAKLNSELREMKSIGNLQLRITIAIVVLINFPKFAIRNRNFKFVINNERSIQNSWLSNYNQSTLSG